MSSPTFVGIQRDGEIATVVIQREEKLNALNGDVIRQLGEAFRSLRDDPEVRGVILTGAGERAFVAGADIGELVGMDPVRGVEVSREGQKVFREIETFPRPVLAAVGGFALGGGCELALACHLRVASENARFGLPEVSLGIIPGYGGTVRLARLVGLGKAVELTLTGAQLDAAAAERLGLVSRVVPRTELLQQSAAFLRTVTGHGTEAVRRALEAVYHAVDASTEAALAHESSLFGLLASTHEMRDRMTAFLERRR